jgi:hypothetical protein
MKLSKNMKLATHKKLSKTVKEKSLSQASKPIKTKELASKNSGRGGIRTHDQGLMSPLLCRLSYPAPKEIRGSLHQPFYRPSAMIVNNLVKQSVP